MDYKRIKFDWKALAATALIVSMWYDLKTDFSVHKEEHKLIEYRIVELERLNHQAILPKGTKIEHAGYR
jgi:hypothetical protein